MEVGAQGAWGLQPQSHPKALEHPTGLPKPATQPRAPRGKPKGSPGSEQPGAKGARGYKPQPPETQPEAPSST